MPEIGSRWYFVGHHYEVIEHTSRDGEAAVRIRMVGYKGSGRFTTKDIVLSLFARRAVPTQ